MPTRIRYTFDPLSGTTGRYRDSLGRYVSERAVRSDVQRVIAGVRQEMIDLTQSLRAGNVTLQEWYDTMRAHMKRTHVIAGSIAKGGWKQMTQADWGRLGAMTKREYAYLNRFARQLASGQIALDGKVVQRAGMYANAGHKTYQENLRIRSAEYSYREERRLIGARGESCDDCIVEAAKGWQPIGTLRPIGDSQCVSNCGCYFEFRERNPGAEMMGLKRLEAQWTT